MPIEDNNNSYRLYFVRFLMIGAALIVGTALCLYHSAKDLCDNRVFQKLEDASAGKWAFVYQRDCGATTAESIHIMIADHPVLRNESGNVLIMPSSSAPPAISWGKNSELIVIHKPNLKAFKKEEQAAGVRILYSAFSRIEDPSAVKLSSERESEDGPYGRIEFAESRQDFLQIINTLDKETLRELIETQVKTASLDSGASEYSIGLVDAMLFHQDPELRLMMVETLKESPVIIEISVNAVDQYEIYLTWISCS